MYVRAGRFTRKNGFIDIRCRGNVRHADLRQELTPSRRTGSRQIKGASVPMIRMIRQDAMRAIQLLGQHHSDQCVWEVSRDSDHLKSLRCWTSGAKPSGPPIRKATSLPSCKRPDSHAASSRVVISLPRSSSATTYSPGRNAARIRWPSASMALSGGRPAVREPARFQSG